jgi:hypothetical protein
VAINTYSHWYGPALKRKLAGSVKKGPEKSKATVQPINVDENDGGGSSKRPQIEDNDTRAPKHYRIEDPRTSSTPRPRPTRKEKQCQMVCSTHYSDFRHR